uniref:Glucoamylase n=2 Tax=Blastobotrys adeninivorans TaxID=409370 RepID=AMYG_BLAAD|nr:RecName: Full=Glucoamylase; AltName: Full=1,4-alpha-D-glucan glucohydrolase; AltName: Full=Glucan 1,4-alpha-glucosidase; Flags: Precursor [Blastobotrys adeninivorans]CAA86997.1 glucoamylase precursor [Blastobotrys adeninivorans]
MRQFLALAAAASIAVADSCHTFTLANSPPDDKAVALSSYSYCGGYLSASAFVKNLSYDKLVTLYWTNADNKSTPLNAGSLDYVKAASDDQSWELWSLNVTTVPDGVDALLNITYVAASIGKTNSQQLNVQVEATGDPIPTPQIPTIYKPYASPSDFSDDITNWLKPSNDSQTGIAKSFLFNNINIPGAAPGTVIAAQSYSEPDYAYTWVRDASLVMDVVNRLYSSAKSEEKRQLYEKILFQYAKAGAQEQNDPTAISGMGEPKFYLNNTAFTGSWGRPQNDGPATRAITLIEFANAYLANGGSQDTVREQLYDSDKYPQVAPIKKDLQFVASNWSSPSFDLWEEEESAHFYTRLVQRKALLLGADFANDMGDHELSDKLKTQASKLSDTLPEFWDSARQLILYEYGPVLRGKYSYKDISVVLGVMHGYANDNVFSYTNDQILATAYQVSTSFLDVYKVANTTSDESGKPLGIPVGRYPEDVYDGVGTSQGNPWYLTTMAMAEFLYRSVQEFEDAGSIIISDTSLPFWKYFASSVDHKAGAKYNKNDQSFKTSLKSLTGWGDAFMRRAKYHTPSSGHMSEEFNRTTGEPRGAKDLTWSYASLLSAAFAREELRNQKNYLTNVADL